MILTTVTMSTLIDEVRQNLYRVTEYPFEVTLGSNDLSSDVDTSLTLTTADEWDSVNVGDILEWGSELVRVSAKSEDVTPVFTVRRGYAGTTATSYAAGTVGTVNPSFPRHRFLKPIERAAYRLDVWLPKIVAAVFSREPGLQLVNLGANTRGVERVSVYNEFTGDIDEIGGWEFRDDLPVTATFTTGKVLSIPRAVRDDTELFVATIEPYAWDPTPVTEASTLAVPQGSEGVLISYAAAYRVTGREIGRIELDRTEEWSKTEPARALAPMQIVRELWQQFYRELDEAQRLNPRMPKHRPYRPRPRRPTRWL
jgi:hypothetical protein